ncbi:hypothetical protein KJZ71_00235 [Patescibacteria group bacterium]|jgi:hypothetical protein|uniref:Uncharacterized protein n=1 Tax=candidate division WWE3 bacterium TaxID=2053526 RepID=A0A928Y5T5_UNCKA|nr:hypothetical protein [candidate division WWE3 bacterium]MCL4732217.1 hypothetical protein [Patescibacteria group bacterium]
MVGPIRIEGQELYKCAVCGHFYETKELADQCEAWCREHESCNTEIIKQAVQ